jgi:hypothetical protein
METIASRWIGKGLAVVPLVVGLSIVWGTTAGLINTTRSIQTASEILSHVLFWFACFVMYGFGGYFIVIAIRLWKGINSRSLRGLSVVLTLIGVCLLFSIIQYVLGHLFEIDEETYQTVHSLLVWLIAGLFYVFCNRSLHRWCRISMEIDPVRHVKTVQWYFGIMALLAITPLFKIIEPIGTQPGRDQNPMLVSFDMILAVGVLSFGWGIYHFGSRIYLRISRQN